MMYLCFTRVVRFLTAVFLGGLFLYTSTANAQQEILTSQWAYNKLTVNPAYAGGKDVLSIRALHRQQWVGLDGRPMTSVVNVHSPLLNNRMGLGLSYVHDQLGVTSTDWLAASYAYRLPFENGSILAFGVSAGFESWRIKTSDLEMLQADDPMLSADLSKINMKAGTGIYYYGSKFYLGISTPNLVPNNLFNKGDLEEGSVLADDSKQVIHMYFMGGYAFELADGNFVIKPQVLVKAVTSGKRNAPFQLDANLSMIMFERLILGSTFRTTIANKNEVDLENVAAADLMLGSYLGKDKQWFVSYAYGFTLGSLKNYDSGSHEIMLGFDINTKKSGTFTPRFF